MTRPRHVPPIDPSKLKSIRVLFEDDELLAVSKPAGMSVHGGAGEKGPTLIDLVRAAYPDGGATVNLAHRLDRATSGLLLLAKTEEAARGVGKSWDTAEKTYLAIALGHVDKDKTIETPIEGRYGEKKTAVTRLHPIAQLRAIEPHTTLLSIGLGTGRTHQIRLHLANLRHPLLMDDKHGDFSANKRWARLVRELIGEKGGNTRAVKHLMLHAWKLALTHPRSGERIELVEPPPEGWSDILDVAGSEVDVLARLS